MVQNIELYLKGWPISDTTEHTRCKKHHIGKQQAEAKDSSRFCLLIPVHHPRATFHMH